jgi:hypothetical protein
VILYLWARKWHYILWARRWHCINGQESDTVSLGKKLALYRWARRWHCIPWARSSVFWSLVALSSSESSSPKRHLWLLMQQHSHITATILSHHALLQVTTYLHSLALKV